MISRPQQRLARTRVDARQGSFQVPSSNSSDPFVLEVLRGLDAGFRLKFDLEAGDQEPKKAPHRSNRLSRLRFAVFSSGSRRPAGHSVE